jgi:AICAR transformylase/IMP cyclohydrolase PurH
MAGSAERDTTKTTREALAAKAFNHTAHYDDAISNYLRKVYTHAGQQVRAEMTQH